MMGVRYTKYQWYTTLVSFVLEETAFYQLLKRRYQFLKSLNLRKKIRGKKSLPTKKLVNKRQSSPQPRINPAFRQKVRKTDGGYVV